MGRKPDPNSLTNRIVQACNAESGCAMADIIAATGGHPPSVNATVPLLIRRGVLHRVGTRMLMRYFARAEHAQAYVEVFKLEREKAALAKKQRRAAYYAAKRREAGQTPRARTPKPPAQPKPRKAAKPKHGPTITMRKAKPKAAGEVSIAHATTVTWPEHVQVQRAPVRHDERYTFTPPPGWRGELVRQWEERRAA